MPPSPAPVRPDLPPLLVRPRYVDKVWGGRRLESVLGRSDLPDDHVGESWEVATLEPWEAVIDGGAFDGQRLRDVWGGPFPLLVKVIDAQQNLSVQVHPDGQDGVPAKEEAWVSLAGTGYVALGTVGRTIPSHRAWLGHLERSRLRAATRNAPPSIVHVPPGTVHAVLAGALLWEVQTPVDVTWRLDDFGRLGLDGKPRRLHLEEARGVLARGSEPRRAPGADGRRLDGHRLWVEAHPAGRWSEPGAPLVAFLVAGGRVEWGEGGAALEVPAGRTVVLPPTTRAIVSDDWMYAAGCA